jgi:hypothetical protein
MSANNRKLTVAEIQAVGSVLNDKEAIELLKQINDNIVTEEDTKGKRKQNDIFAFVGFAHNDDILGEDEEAEDYQNKKGVVRKLVDAGLVIEGFHIPLERKSEKKFGDVRVQSDERISKYQITEEGFAVLALTNADVAAPAPDVIDDGSNKEQQQKAKATPVQKEKALEAFKEEIKKEDSK